MTFQERFVANNLVITYSEYLEAVDEVEYKSAEERIKDDEGMPAWFIKYQKKALALFRKAVPQVQCLPRNRMDYLDLKPQMWVEEGTNIYHNEPYNYKNLFLVALSEQIKYYHDNEVWVDNGYLNATGFSVANYSQGGQQKYMIDKFFKGICPSAYDSLESMGWMNACLNHPLDTRLFYKGEL